MNKEAALYSWLKSGKPITHWEAVRKWDMLDFRKAITRIGSKELVHRRWRDGVNCRYKEYWISTSHNSKARA